MPFSLTTILVYTLSTVAIIITIVVIILLLLIFYIILQRPLEAMEPLPLGPRGNADRPYDLAVFDART